MTGAAQGIGRTIALRLARDGLGVAVTDLPSNRQRLDDLASEIKDMQGQKVVALTGDVSNEADVKHMTESVVEQLGGLDVVRLERFADCCGIADSRPADDCKCWDPRLGETDRPYVFAIDQCRCAMLKTKTTLSASSAETWDRIILTNLRGTMLSYKYAALQMIRQGRGGRIIGRTEDWSSAIYSHQRTGASSVAGKRGQSCGDDCCIYVST